MTTIEPRESLTSTPSEDRVERIHQAAHRIRLNALNMGEVQGQGYIGQALGVADMLAVIYTDQLRHRPEDPHWPDRDRFLLSIGHYAIALYAALIEARIIPEDELESYGSDDSRLPMSSMASYTPGVEISGGSLGHGLGIAVGMALALKRKKSKSFVYNLLSDGELDEGHTWEAAMSAGSYKLDHLIAIVDVNNQQADGPSTEILNFEPLAPKFEAFGWYTQRIDGNDIEAVAAAFDKARGLTEPKPRVVICDTRMGKGIPFLEERERNHFLRVEPDEWQKALAILDAGRGQ